MSTILQQFGRGAMLAVLALALSQSVVTAAGLRIGGGGKVSRAIGGGTKSIGGAKIPAIRGSSGSRIASSPSRSSILRHRPISRVLRCSITFDPKAFHHRTLRVI